MSEREKKRENASPFFSRRYSFVSKLKEKGKGKQKKIRLKEAGGEKAYQPN